MDLVFNKVEHTYVSEFEAVNDFNLHVEKGVGAMSFYQKSVADGDYALSNNLTIDGNATVFDTTVIVPVAPMYIKVVSYVEPTMAVVTFPSDVQEAIDASIVSNLNTPV